MYNKTY